MVTEVVKCGIGGELPSDDDASGAVRHTVLHAEVLGDEDVGTVVEKEANGRALECGIWQSVEVHAFAVTGVGAAGRQQIWELGANPGSQEEKPNKNKGRPTSPAECCSNQEKRISLQLKARSAVGNRRIYPKDSPEGVRPGLV
jgi:hypothetical protein